MGKDAWGDLDRLARGERDAARAARPPLSRGRIVAAAVRLADIEGVGAVSMSRLGKELGFSAMSLYRHVNDKDELLLLMAHAALGPPPESLDVPGDEWRPAIRRWADELLAVLGRHPWVTDILAAGPPRTPSQLAWLDRGLRALAGTGLTEPEKAAVLLLLNGQVSWHARIAAAAAPAPAAAHETISSLVDADELWALRRALDAGIFEDASASVDLSFGLERVLDGVRCFIDARSGTS